MAKSSTGTKLFGWCFPDMPPSQHAICKRYSGTEDAPRECPCECHQPTLKPKNKTTKKKTKEK